MEAWPRGLRRSLGERVTRKGPWVQILPPPFFYIKENKKYGGLISAATDSALKAAGIRNGMGIDTSALRLEDELIWL